MILSDADIRKARANGDINVTHWDDELVQPASLDLRLGPSFLRPVGWETREEKSQKHWVADPARDFSLVWEQGRPYDDGTWVMRPGDFALGSTYETVTLGPGIAAQVEGKSSLGRLGFSVHVTAGFIDPGFTGQITLELKNVAPWCVRLHPGMRIAQLCFMRLTQPATRLYGTDTLGSRYQGQTGPTPSKSWKNWKTWDVT